MTEAEEKHNMQVAVAGSVIFHSALLFILAWLMGLDQTARALWAAVNTTAAQPVKQEPVVTMVFPDQILREPRLKPKLSDLQKFVRTDHNADTGKKPAKSDFISDRNTTAAASQAPFPTALEPVPTLSGVRVPSLEIRNQKETKGEEPALRSRVAMSLPKTEAGPTQNVAKSSAIKMLETMDAGPQPDTRLPLEVKKAVLATASGAEPTLTPPVEAKPSFMTPALPSEVKGSISVKGEDAVNAESTAVGKFMREVTSAVEKRWHELFNKVKKDSVSASYLRISFLVNKEGHPEDLKFIEKTGNVVVEDLTLEAVLKAGIPPIPKEILPMLPNERLSVEYDIVIQ